MLLFRQPRESLSRFVYATESSSLIMIIREKRAFYGWCFRFTELFVDELDDPGDLRLLVKTYLQSLSGAPINGIVDFYQNVRHRASKSLADGTGRRPHFRLFCSFSDVSYESVLYRLSHESQESCIGRHKSRLGSLFLNFQLVCDLLMKLLIAFVTWFLNCRLQTWDF